MTLAIDGRPLLQIVLVGRACADLSNSEGIARVANLICHRAPIAAQGDRARVVNTEMVTTVARDLELQLQR